MIRTVSIENRQVVIGGIGKLFYQEGMPISISVKHLENKGLKVSIYHIADELLKNGWSSKTVFNKMREDLADSGEKYDIESLKSFIFAEYEKQREMIFEYLFEDNEKALNFLRNESKLNLL